MEREKLVKLVTAAQSGKPDAIEKLFETYYNDVYYFALKTVKDSDIACDITQETFLEIIHTIGNLKEPAAFVTWMKQITYHQCTRYFKKKKEVLVEEDEDGNTIFDTLADESEDSIPSEIYEQAEFRETILGIINELTEQQRSAVMMYYFDELTVAQIAQIQGVSDGTVKSRLNYARKAIKKSVESYEKKHNVRLHSFAILPLLLLFFGKERMPAGKAAEIRVVVGEAAGAVGAGSASAAGASASGSATAAVTGVGAKIAAMPLVTKIVAGVMAAAIVVGGGAGWMASRSGGQEIQGHTDTTVHPEFHSYVDGICEFCGEVEDSHRDEDANAICDHCGVAMCVLELGEHSIPEGACLCEYCGQGQHTPGGNHAICGICGVQLPLDDRDGDGACDICGEYSCGGAYHGNSHGDEDGDDHCDICQKAMCGLVWGIEHTYDYSDGIYDGKCDSCGGNGEPIGWPDGAESSHGDADGDGKCDCCDRPVCDVYGMPEYGGVDEDGDEKCDICNFYMCDGHGRFVYHYDFDGDEKCDRCGHYICAHGFLPHTDGNGDGRCDKCYSLI